MGMVTQDRPLRRGSTTGACAAAAVMAACSALPSLVARETAMRVVAGRGIAIEVVLFDRDGRLTGHAPFASHHATPPRNLRR